MEVQASDGYPGESVNRSQTVRVLLYDCYSVHLMWDEERTTAPGSIIPPSFAMMKVIGRPGRSGRLTRSPR